MKNTAGCLICVVVVQTVLVFQQATGIALLPPPQTTSVLARSDAGLWQWHYYQQRIAVLHHCMLVTTFAAAFVALDVRRRAAGTEEAQPPARMLRASMLLAVTLSLASSALAAATQFYVLQVQLATIFLSFSGAAKSTLWACYTMVWLLSAVVHYDFAARAIGYE
jgi:hypothetical protein